MAVITAVIFEDMQSNLGGGDSALALLAKKAALRSAAAISEVESCVEGCWSQNKEARDGAGDGAGRQCNSVSYLLPMCRASWGDLGGVGSGFRPTSDVVILMTEL